MKIFFGAGQFSRETLVGGRPGTTIFQTPGGGGGGRIQGPGPAAPPGILRRQGWGRGEAGSYLKGRGL